MVLIEIDDVSEMLRITKGGEILFNDNYWDFDITDLGGLLTKCGIEVIEDTTWEYDNE